MKTIYSIQELAILQNEYEKTLSQKEGSMHGSQRTIVGFEITSFLLWIQKEGLRALAKYAKWERISAFERIKNVKSRKDAYYAWKFLHIETQFVPSDMARKMREHLEKICVRKFRKPLPQIISEHKNP